MLKIRRSKPAFYFRRTRNLGKLYAKALPAILAASIVGFATAVYFNGMTASGARPASSAAGQEIYNVKASAIFSGEIREGETLISELLKLNVPKYTTNKIITRLSRIFNLEQCRAGDRYHLFLSGDDSILAFEYLTVDSSRYRLEKMGGDFVDEVYDNGYQVKTELATAIVSNSLWDNSINPLPDPDLLARCAHVYAGQIDFLTESDAGDTIKVLYEAHYGPDKSVKCGKILAMEYSHKGSAQRAFYFTDPEGNSDYYDESGYSLRRAMLKSPLDYRCISSRFSSARLHPIYKIYRPHLGVDYAAAYGTPVVAAGDGRIIFKGYHNGFGNYLEIEHDFGLTTTYGHLAKFADIELGMRVKQGEIIGYVGATGDATGPHLDYRVRKDGKYINPLRMTVPAAPPVKLAYMREFREVVAQRLAVLKGSPEYKLYAAKM